MGKSGANFSVQTESEYEPIGEESRPLLAQVNPNHSQSLLSYRNKKKNQNKKNERAAFSVSQENV